jgi:hypothetical protein
VRAWRKLLGRWRRRRMVLPRGWERTGCNGSFLVKLADGRWHALRDGDHLLFDFTGHVVVVVRAEQKGVAA